tara:strand:- start:3339 stop:3527 length:189 start_codon:yes stop_codon:yes gene_type:complete
MESNSTSIIFLVGALTFLLNWYLYQISTEINLSIFIKNLIVSVIGVLATGIIFVVALHIAHG